MRRVLPLPREDHRAPTLGLLSTLCVTRTLGLVAAAAVVLALWGCICVFANDICPPLLPTVNNSNSDDNTDVSNTGVGLLMVTLGAVALLPVAFVRCVQLGHFRSLIVGAGPGPTKLNLLEGSLMNNKSSDHFDAEHTFSEELSDPQKLKSTPASPAPSSTGAIKTELSKRQAVGMLFAAHFLSAWGDRMWQFAVPVLFIEIFLDTLAPTALYAFLVYAACVQFMPAVGTWVDRAHRLSVQRFALIVDNASVVGTSVLLCYIAVTETHMGLVAPEWTGGFTLCFIGIIVLGISGEVMNQAQTLSVERDWVVVIAEEMGSLAVMNTTMRRIDLMCKVLAPAAVGAIISTVGSSSRMKVFYGSAAVGVWNALAFPLELLLTTLVFDSFPALDSKMHSHMDGVTKHSHPGGHKEHSHFLHKHAASGDAQETEPHCHDVFGPLDHLHPEDGVRHEHGRAHGHSHGTTQHYRGESKRHKDEPDAEQEFAKWGPVILAGSHFSGNSIIGDGRGKSSPCTALLRGYRSYVRHPVLFASVSLSLLYCTVLDNGALMTAYLTWRRDPASWVLVGVLGQFWSLRTIVCPQLLKRNGLAGHAGLYSVWFLFV